MDKLETELMDFINKKLKECPTPEQRLECFDLLAALALHEAEHARWQMMMRG